MNHHELPVLTLHPVVAIPASAQVGCQRVQGHVSSHYWPRFGPPCTRHNIPETNAGDRFVDTEKWRKETNLDETVPIWDYPEKPEIAKYYKQFYHKTDKVNTTKRFMP